MSLRIQELEQVLTKTWPAHKQELFGKWLLRSSGKFTMRANSVLPMGKAPYGEPPTEIDDAILFVIAHYKKEKLTPTFSIPLPTYQDLDSKLAENGWIEKIRAHVMVADIEHVEPVSSKYSITISDQCDDIWLALQSDHGVADLMRAYPAMYASVFDGESLIAVGRAAHSDGWSALARVFVDPNYRGQGVSKLVTTALLNAASDADVKKAVLQVDSENTAAINLYTSLGFSFHHEYIYRTYQESLPMLTEECC